MSDFVETFTYFYQIPYSKNFKVWTKLNNKIFVGILTLFLHQTLQGGHILKCQKVYRFLPIKVKIWYLFIIFSNFSLRRHVYKEHEKEKHTKCIHCDRMFLWPCDMEYHCDMQHKGTAPVQFSCDVCNKGNISVENRML